MRIWSISGFWRRTGRRESCSVHRPGPGNGKKHFRDRAKGPETCTAYKQTAAGPFTVSLLYKQEKSGGWLYEDMAGICPWSPAVQIKYSCNRWTPPIQ